MSIIKQGYIYPVIYEQEIKYLVLIIDEDIFILFNSKLVDNEESNTKDIISQINYIFRNSVHSVAGNVYPMFFSDTKNLLEHWLKIVKANDVKVMSLWDIRNFYVIVNKVFQNNMLKPLRHDSFQIGISNIVYVIDNEVKIKESVDLVNCSRIEIIEHVLGSEYVRNEDNTETYNQLIARDVFHLKSLIYLIDLVRLIS